MSCWNHGSAPPLPRGIPRAACRRIRLRQRRKGGSSYWRYRWGSRQPGDPAGAFIDDTTLARARRVGLDPVRYLDDNNSTEFFEKLTDLLVSGPTLTNVNDFRAVLVDSP